jgi:hypothetical protein
VLRHFKSIKKLQGILLTHEHADQSIHLSVVSAFSKNFPPDLSNVIERCVDLLLVTARVQNRRRAPWASAVSNLARLLIHPSVHAVNLDDMLALGQVDEPDQTVNGYKVTKKETLIM